MFAELESIDKLDYVQRKGFASANMMPMVLTIFLFLCYDDLSICKKTVHKSMKMHYFKTFALFHVNQY